MSSDILKTVYYSLFDTHLRCAGQVWGQDNSDILVMVQEAQNKALRIIHLNSKEEKHPCESIFKNSTTGLKLNIFLFILFILKYIKSKQY